MFAMREGIYGGTSSSCPLVMCPDLTTFCLLLQVYDAEDRTGDYSWVQDKFTSTIISLSLFLFLCGHIFVLLSRPLQLVSPYIILTCNLDNLT